MCKKGYYYKFIAFKDFKQKNKKFDYLSLASSSTNANTSRSNYSYTKSGFASTNCVSIDNSGNIVSNTFVLSFNSNIN